MDDKIFSLLCALVSFLLSLISSVIIRKLDYNKRLKEEKYKFFYKQFYVLWNNIHQGRAYDFSDLKKYDRENIVDFLLENYNYAPEGIQDLIYSLKTNRLDDFDNNDKQNIERCNDCYNKIIEYMINKETKHRKKYSKVNY